MLKLGRYFTHDNYELKSINQDLKILNDNTNDKMIP